MYDFFKSPLNKFVSQIFCLLSVTQSAIAQYHFSEVDKLLVENKSKLGNNINAMIYKDGKLIYKKQIGDMTTNKITPIASCSKWLSAPLVMSFVDEGKLLLEDTVGKFLPIFSHYEKGSIKIKNCLSHTTGIESGSLNLFPFWMKIIILRPMHR